MRKQHMSLLPCKVLMTCYCTHCTATESVGRKSHHGQSGSCCPESALTMKASTAIGYTQTHPERRSLQGVCRAAVAHGKPHTMLQDWHQNGLCRRQLEVRPLNSKYGHKQLSEKQDAPMSCNAVRAQSAETDRRRWLEQCNHLYKSTSCLVTFTITSRVKKSGS